MLERRQRKRRLTFIINCAFASLGSYGVILDERHYRELLMQHVIPPVAKVSTQVHARYVYAAVLCCMHLLVFWPKCFLFWPRRGSKSNQHY